MKIFKLNKEQNVNSLAFFNIMGPIILNGINFLTIPIFTRFLGTVNYGRVALYTTWVQILSILVGLETSGSIATARIHIGKDESKEYCASVLFLSFCTFLIIATISFAFIKPISRLVNMNEIVILLALVNSFATYVITFATIKFTFDKQSYKTFFISVLVSISSVVLSLIFIYETQNYENRYIGRILGHALPNIIIGILIFVFFMYRGKTFFNKTYWKFCLPICLPLIFHALSQTVLSQSDKIMLQNFSNDSIVGTYSLIVTFTQIINIIWSALNNTWVPFYYDDVSAKNIKSIKSKTNNYLYVFTILTLGFILLSPEIVKLFSSSDFWGGIDLIPILSVGMYFVFLYSFPANFQFYHKKTANIAIGTVAAGLINIILNFLLIPKFTMMGAAMATLISYILLFFFQHIVAKYLVKNDYHYELKDFIFYILAICGGIIVFYLFKNLWIIRWMIGFILGVIMIKKIIKNKAIF